MMERFGSWSEYRTAPRIVVEEQILEWCAEQDAKADNAKESPKP